MHEKTIKRLHALVRLCNESIVEPDRAAYNAKTIKAGLLELIDATPAANAPRNKVQVIELPDTTALAYNKAFAPELPRLTAYVAPELNKPQQDCKIYLGNDVLAELTVYQKRSFAVRMVRMALKGAMSCLGKRRRHAANQRKKEGK